MATSKAKAQTSRGRAQDRRLVAASQDHEVRYEAEKTSSPKAAVKAAAKRAGSSRKKIENELAKSK